MAGLEDLRFVPGSEFTVRWNLKNFSYFGVKDNNSLTSKTVVVPSLDNSEWYLKLISRGPLERSIMCFLCRNDNGPDNIRVFYSISVDSSYAVEFQTFGKGGSSVMPGVINHEKFLSSVTNGSCEDVLHIECRLWMHTDGNTGAQTRLVSPYPVSVSMTTEIAVENRSFFYEVDNFTGRPESDMVSVGLASAGHGGLKLVLRLWTENQTLRVILREQEDAAQEKLFVLKCKIQFLDVFKKRRLLYSGRGVFNSKGDRSDRTWNFPLNMSRKELIEKKDLYLPKNALLLFCEINVADTSSVNLMESTVYDTSLQTSDHDFQWGMYLDHVYNKHRVLFRLIAILVVLLSIIPHFYFDSTV